MFHFLKTSLVSSFLLYFGFCVQVSTVANAAELHMQVWRGHSVLKLTGRIDESTARRFRALAPTVRSLPHGLPVLLLDGPGGSVSAAMKMSKVMDQFPFHTVVPNGSRCASACASIVFIAGKLRSVEPLGTLGQHSCSRNGVPDRKCNEAISQHALEHGVSYGSVEAFVSYVRPEEIQWFSRKYSDGWGLTRYPGEIESGFEKSEPLVIQLIAGRKPAAQSAWRLDFREDGYRAFLRPVSDDERELELNVFCNESLKGRLFVSVQVGGPAQLVAANVIEVIVATDRFAWKDPKPTIWQMDPTTTEIITEVPRRRLIDILTKVDAFQLAVKLRRPYEPMIANTYLGRSGKVLRFAANNCPSGSLAGPTPPLQ